MRTKDHERTHRGSSESEGESEDRFRQVAGGNEARPVRLRGIDETHREGLPASTLSLAQWRDKLAEAVTEYGLVSWEVGLGITNSAARDAMYRRFLDVLYTEHEEG